MRCLLLISAVLLLITLEQFCGATIQQAKHEGIDPANFVTIGNDSYYISPSGAGGVSVTGAREYCADFGMKLISFQTLEKWTTISRYLDTNGYSSSFTYWTSGFEVVAKWYWTATDEEITYFNWAPGEPNSNGPSDCLHFYQNSGWYDTDCENEFHYMCEN